MFYGSGQRFYCLGSYLNSSDLGDGATIYRAPALLAADDTGVDGAAKSRRRTGRSPIRGT